MYLVKFAVEMLVCIYDYIETESLNFVIFPTQENGKNLKMKKKTAILNNYFSINEIEIYELFACFFLFLLKLKL